MNTDLEDFFKPVKLTKWQRRRESKINRMVSKKIIRLAYRMRRELK
jgi:hypothetical protein